MDQFAQSTEAPNRQKVGGTGQVPNRQKVGGTGQVPNRHKVGGTGQVPNRQKIQLRQAQLPKQLEAGV
ncbi:MAG: hypothetical protein RBU37_02450 [Myxococcota bacterium]|nr:hypothetical protein [Myxococcota bacterium]